MGNTMTETARQAAGERPLTADQIKALRRMARDVVGAAAIGKRVGEQLAKRGLAFDTHALFERMEFGRVLARIAIYQLTTEGEAVAKRLLAEVTR